MPVNHKNQLAWILFMCNAIECYQYVKAIIANVSLKHRMPDSITNFSNNAAKNSMIHCFTPSLAVIWRQSSQIPKVYITPVHSLYIMPRFTSNEFPTVDRTSKALPENPRCYSVTKHSNCLRCPFKRSHKNQCRDMERPKKDQTPDWGIEFIK